MNRDLRTARQRQLLRLLQSGSFASQEALSEALAGKGFAVSQATLSRDLRQLGALRMAGPEGTHYALPREEPAPRGQDLLALEVTAVQANECVVLLKTWPGRAPGVASSLDHLELPELLGTVAGDDTVLVVPRSTRRVKALRRQIEQTLLGA